MDSYTHELEQKLCKYQGKVAELELQVKQLKNELVNARLGNSQAWSDLQLENAQLKTELARVIAELKGE